MELKLDAEAIREMLKASVLQQLTPEAQEKLIENAVTHVLKEKVRDGYNAPTTLQQMFNDAVRSHASKLIDEALEDPAVSAKIQSVVMEAATKAFTPDSDARNRIVERLADAIRKELVGY